MMNHEITSPEDSLQLIARTIRDAKNSLKGMSHAFILWGTLLGVTSMAQFILIRMELGRYSHYPYFIMVLGAVYSYLSYRRKARKENLPKTIIGNILMALGSILGFNFMILGFFFWNHLQDNMIPVFMIMLALWIMISGISLRYRFQLIAGILMNLAALAAFFIQIEYHPLIVSISSFATILVPGIILYTQERKENV